MGHTPFDPYGAMLSVHNTLTTLRAIAYLDPKGMSCHWERSMHVALQGEATGSVSDVKTSAFLPTRKLPPRVDG